jgi:hypothetical protein
LSEFDQFEAERFDRARTPNTADRSSSKPVSTVTLPFSSYTIEEKVDRAVAGVDWASEHGKRLA